MTVLNNIEVCILAAGVGSRMHSVKAKALQTIAGKYLLRHLLDTTAVLHAVKTHVVVGQGADSVKATFSSAKDITWVLQEQRLGTGHAVQQAAPNFDDEAKIIVLLGDAPLIRAETLQKLLALDADLAVLTVEVKNPFNYGRVIRRGTQITKIIEEKDATASEKTINEINTGVMVARARPLKRWLAMLDDNNAQQEFLLTDIVSHANAEGSIVTAFKIDDVLEVTGINTFAQLAAMERALQHRLATELMDQGVQVMDPARLDIRGNLSVGRGVTLDVNVIFEGDVALGNDVTIGPNCVLKDCRIGDGSVIKANSVLEGATIGGACSVGPFARLRPGTVLADEVAIGNFVETKKATLGRGSKASHLTYIGDTTIGERVNIGAGTITCNYDGVNKHETHIGDDVFVGSNSSLVAPVTIGSGATIGAGSTITKKVEPDVLAIGRGRQISISHWQRPVKKTT